MKIDLNKSNRSHLSTEQKEALMLLTPLSILISDWVQSKCHFLGKPGNLYASIILGDLLVESEFLTHPLSKSMLGNRYSNNLTRIARDKTWTGKSLEHEGKEYKTYRDWTHFSSDYSDILCFTDLYDDMLSTRAHDRQLALFSSFKPDPKWYTSKVSTLLDFYNLGEFDGSENS